MEEILKTIKDFEKELDKKSSDTCLKNNEMFLFH